VCRKSGGPLRGKTVREFTMSSPPVADRVVSEALIPVLRSRDLHSALVCEAATRLAVWRCGGVARRGAGRAQRHLRKEHPLNQFPSFTHAGPIERKREILSRRIPTDHDLIAPSQSHRITITPARTNTQRKRQVWPAKMIAETPPGGAVLSVRGAVLPANRRRHRMSHG
jgi:hypothetical protein